MGQRVKRFQAIRPRRPRAVASVARLAICLVSTLMIAQRFWVKNIDVSLAIVVRDNVYVVLPHYRLGTTREKSLLTA
jgi:hypothetical protein